MQRRTLFGLVLLFCIIGAAAICVTAIVSYQTASPPPAPSPGDLPLAALGGSARAAVDPMPPWMPLLIGVFTLLQITPLALAMGRSRKDSEADVREINFLCEVPMYLGLLGSLLGVSLTQYLSGTVAAPLAYLTTISGIILFLLGKYMIALPYEQIKTRIGGTGLL